MNIFMHQVAKKARVLKFIGSLTRNIIESNYVTNWKTIKIDSSGSCTQILNYSLKERARVYLGVGAFTCTNVAITRTSFHL